MEMTPEEALVNALDWNDFQCHCGAYCADCFVNFIVIQQ